jgi:hypothetical protein
MWKKMWKSHKSLSAVIKFDRSKLLIELEILYGMWINVENFLSL